MASINLPYILERRPSSEFNPDAAKNKLAHLTIDCRNGPDTSMIVAGDLDGADTVRKNADLSEAGRQAKLLRLGGWIDLESRVTVPKPPRFQADKNIAEMTTRLDVRAHS